jgi:hypothetical protein
MKLTATLFYQPIDKVTPELMQEALEESSPKSRIKILRIAPLSIRIFPDPTALYLVAGYDKDEEQYFVADVEVSNNFADWNGVINEVIPDGAEAEIDDVLTTFSDLLSEYQ